MRREEHLLNELLAYRFTGEDPKYALIISHGIASHGGIYNIFCEHHAAKGADIWSYDAPGHGKSTTNRPRGQWTLEEWAQASRDFAAHVKKETGLPVFTLGSSMGAGAAISAINSPDVNGTIIMGSMVIPGSPHMQRWGGYWNEDACKTMLESLGRAVRLDVNMLFSWDEDYGYKGALEQKKSDPWNTFSYDLASWASLFQYQPEPPLSENEKPVLFLVGEDEPNFTPDVIEGVVEYIGGPVGVKWIKGGTHQLMLFSTEEFSDHTHAFCLENL